MPTISNVSEKRTVEVLFDVNKNEAGEMQHEVLHVTYSRVRMTTDYQRQRNAEMEDKTDEAKTLMMMIDIMESWDLTDDAGAPIPLNYETLDTQVPTSVLYKVAAALTEAQRPNDTPSDNSDATF